MSTDDRKRKRLLLLPKYQACDELKIDEEEVSMQVYVMIVSVGAGTSKHCSVIVVKNMQVGEDKILYQVGNR